MNPSPIVPVMTTSGGRPIELLDLSDLMGELKLYGMKAAFDEIMATAVKRQHEPQRIVGELLTAEVSEKQAHSIRYQLTIAKLPLAKDLDDFEFTGTPINENARSRSRRRRLPCPTAQRCSGRRHRYRQDPFGYRDCSKLHLAAAPAAGSKHRRSGQPARERDPQRTPGPARRTSDTHGLHCPRRTRLSPIRSVRWPAPVPPC